MSSEHLVLSRRGPLAVVTLDRPARRNALHAPMWEALRALPEALAADPPRAVVLHGAGEHFCAGMDLSPDNALVRRLGPLIAEGDEVGARALVRELKACLQAVADLPCPTLAAVEGACAGSGLELALACDLVVASTTAFFAMPELQVGLAPDVGGTVRLVRRLGRARATELVLTGRRIDAATALSWGLVSRTCEAGRALDTALALAAEVLTSAPEATAAVLPVLRAADGLPDDAALHAETEAGVTTLLAGEVLEGAAAFLGRRKPSWAEDAG